MLEFFIPLKKIPTVTHQQKKAAVKNGKPVFYEDEKLKLARELFMAHLSNYRPDTKLEGPIRLTTKWLFPLTKGKRNGEYKVTKPDTDNLIKLFKDCMTKLGYWHDDAQVASDIIEKFHSDVVGIYVKIESLEMGTWT